jgi:hypothetical protein
MLQTSYVPYVKNFILQATLHDYTFGNTPQFLYGYKSLKQSLQTNFYYVKLFSASIDFAGIKPSVLTLTHIFLRL